MKSLKGTLSSLAGLIGSLTGIIALAIQQGVVTFFPAWVGPICALIALLCGGFIGWAVDKNPNLTNKTLRQVDDINNKQAETKNIK